MIALGLILGYLFIGALAWSWASNWQWHRIKNCGGYGWAGLLVVLLWPWTVYSTLRGEL